MEDLGSSIRVSLKQFNCRHLDIFVTLINIFRRCVFASYIIISHDDDVNSLIFRVVRTSKELRMSLVKVDEHELRDRLHREYVISRKTRRAPLSEQTVCVWQCRLVSRYVLAIEVFQRVTRRQEHRVGSPYRPPTSHADPCSNKKIWKTLIDARETLGDIQSCRYRKIGSRARVPLHVIHQRDTKLIIIYTVAHPRVRSSDRVFDRSLKRRERRRDFDSSIIIKCADDYRMVPVNLTIYAAHLQHPRIVFSRAWACVYRKHAAYTLHDLLHSTWTASEKAPTSFSRDIIHSRRDRRPCGVAKTYIRRETRRYPFGRNVLSTRVYIRARRLSIDR